MHALKAVKVHPLVAVGVPDYDYPVITEWDWTLEDGLALRYKQGKRILMYHELLESSIHKNRPLPMLGSRMTHFLFGRKLVFRRLRKTVKTLEARAKELQVKFPNYIDVLSASLTLAYCEYVEWRDDNTRYVFMEPDQAATEIGMCMPIEGNLPRWAYLGDFMYGELTGRLSSQGPEMYADRFGVLTGKLFRAYIVEANPGKSADDIWDQLTTKDALMEKFLYYTHGVLCEFPLPDLS